MIASDEVLETLLTLPVAREAGMTLADLRTVVGADHDTVWTALAAMLAYLLELASREAGRRWRGAFDLWQAVYLGLPIRAFVTDDRALTEAACRLRDVLKEPREVMTAAQFFDRL